MQFTGELAALATAILWSFTSIFFTLASQRIGSYHLNKVRIPLAVFFLAGMLLLKSGRLLPPDVQNESYYYLIASGIIGLSIGDFFLFSSFVVLGTRLTMLIFASSPILAALMAWMMLGEHLGFLAIFGILLTIGGIIWVVSERQPSTQKNQPKIRKKLFPGVLLALGAGAGQAAGLVLAKAGMEGNLDPLPATFIRMSAAAIAVWMFGFIRNDNLQTLKKLNTRKTWLFTIGGSICGPFLGVWLSLISVKHTEAGIAAAIMATVPVIVIPLVIFVFKEKVSSRAVIGAFITVAGVAILFLT